jgi:hypothetical protein
MKLGYFEAKDKQGKLASFTIKSGASKAATAKCVWRNLVYHTMPRLEGGNGELPVGKYP